jgi:CDGSH iron-sulfur domain-containing protein 3
MPSGGVALAHRSRMGIRGARNRRPTLFPGPQIRFFTPNPKEASQGEASSGWGSYEEQKSVWCPRNFRKCRPKFVFHLLKRSLKRRVCMSEPIIAQKSPYPVEVEASKPYYWCACGRSAAQPFCDGSHKGTDFTPVKFEATESKTVYFCGCKHSANKPFCDGSHAKR